MHKKELFNYSPLLQALLEKIKDTPLEVSWNKIIPLVDYQQLGPLERNLVDELLSERFHIQQSARAGQSYKAYADTPDLLMPTPEIDTLSLSMEAEGYGKYPDPISST